MAVTTSWNKETIEPSSSWSEEINDIHHTDTGTVWGPEAITPTSIWAGALTGAINPTSGTVWGPEAIAPTTSWTETLEQFKIWNDGNAFWQEVNAKYEDL